MLSFNKTSLAINKTSLAINKTSPAISSRLFLNLMPPAVSVNEKQTSKNCPAEIHE